MKVVGRELYSVEAVRTVPKPDGDERQSCHDAPSANGLGYLMKRIVNAAAALEDVCDRQLSPHLSSKMPWILIR